MLRHICLGDGGLPTVCSGFRNMRRGQCEEGLGQGRSKEECQAAMHSQQVPEVPAAGPKGFLEERLPLASEAEGKTDTEMLNLGAILQLNR